MFRPENTIQNLSGWRAGAVLFLSTAVLHDAGAQFLRLGPFDFAASSSLDLIYTTNVDDVRPSDADKEMEDYYFTVSLDLTSQADISSNTRVQLDTGIAIEKHFVRDDLDNSESPFGRGRISTFTEFGHYQFTTFASYERDYEKELDEFRPSGTETSRDVHDDFDYGAGLRWQREPFTLSADYEVNSERHDDPEFQAGDKDEISWTYMAAWQFAQNMSLRYEVEKTKTILVNSPGEDEGYDNTETIALDATLKLIKRPQVTYSLGLEKEDTDEGDGEWEPIHNLNARDDWHLSPTLHLGVDANYSYEQSPEADDITFTYGAFLDHELSATAQQSFSARREPRSTFGSTTDTDTTTFGYGFKKNDLFIYNLSFALDITYEINKPPVGEKEEVLSYDASLAYQRALSRKLTRELKYEYSLEDSSLEEELLEEHRVTLSYVYTF